MTNRPTPRTDRLINEQLGRRVKTDPGYAREQEIIEHAKELERENAELRGIGDKQTKVEQEQVVLTQRVWI